MRTVHAPARHVDVRVHVGECVGGSSDVSGRQGSAIHNQVWVDMPDAVGERLDVGSVRRTVRDG